MNYMESAPLRAYETQTRPAKDAVCCEAPRKMGTIESCLKRQEQVTESLVKVMQDLKVRLDPVLIAMPQPEQCHDGAECACTVSQQINNNTNTLILIHDQLAGLLHRIDL